MSNIYNLMLSEKNENGFFDLSKYSEDFILNHIDEFLPDNYIVLLFVESGSKLYGTHSQSSDKDYTCLFLPSLKDRVFHRDPDIINASTGTKNSKNSNKDIDVKFINFFKFIDDLKNGDINAIDILFSIFSKECVLGKNLLYEEFARKNYYLFLSKRSNSIFSYCSTQAKKYGLKGKDYLVVLQAKNDIENALSMEFSSLDKIGALQDKLSTYFIETNKGVFFKLGNKSFNVTTKIIDILKHIELSLSSYGDRTKTAAEAGGIDYKSLSHAFRALWQFEEIANTGFVIFPLQYADRIVDIKYNNIFKDLEEAVEEINKELFRVEEVLNNSTILTSSIEIDTIDQIVLDFLLNFN